VKDNLFHLHGGNIHTYRRMIHHMDEGIGWIMEALRKHGMADDTLVVFTSDNGGERFSDNWPLVGGKMDLTEGGIRVPWIAHWPAVIAKGGVSAQQCMTMDWSATMLDAGRREGRCGLPARWRVAAAGAADAKAQLRAPAALAHEPPRPAALRDGDWKYLRVDGNDYLFNIPADERERANLAGKRARAAGRDARCVGKPGTRPCRPSRKDATVSLGYSVKDMPQR
jgi:arylsulfatase A-like enzyme